MTDNKKHNQNLQLQSQLVHAGHFHSQYLEVSEPLYLNSGYTYQSAEQAAASFRGETDNYIYSRYANPTIKVFETRMTQLEGAQSGLATATGMAAIFAALICSLKQGDRVVAARELFSSCFYIIDEILPRYGIETCFVDGADLNQWKAALREKPTKLVFFESPTNPMLAVLDVKAICDLAKENGAKVVIDNIMATPIFQRPLTLGADVVCYSTTKHIDGQGRSLGGIVLSDEAFVEDHLRPFLRHTGPGMSPFNAWIALKGLETIHLRVNAQAAAAHKVASFLEGHKAVETCYYPGLESHAGHMIAKTQMTGFGTVLSFRLKQDNQKAAFGVLNRLGLVKISNNFADTKSLATHPATTTHSKLTQDERDRQRISDGVIRLSVGLESVDDIITDLDQALQA